MQTEEDFIQRCLNNDSQAQEELYRRFAPKMFGICLRFTKNKMEAEDVLQEGFIKIFTYLKDYRSEGSLEGWIRRTIINTAINYYKKRAKQFGDVQIE
ncbi:MAG: sigma-70 family RNA polymerase sigma factor, partial [Bacteroidota bacterium]|nr:sigma-70 family RNA polymerase sigma factor [Bacteroidota bacterium]